MPTPQELKQDVMSKINGVMAALNLYPQLTPTNTQLSFSVSANPIDLLVDFFKTTKGYDWLIDKVSKFITYELPALELAVKGVLLSNIRIMLSCSVTPIITQKMINDGIVIDLDKIDLLHIFGYSPLDRSHNNPGKYYYFGCDPEDGVNMIDDLKFSRDFNALIWYAKNTPGERIIWRRENDIDKPFNLKQTNSGWLKQVKSNGIATIEFNGRSTGLKKADGTLHRIQEPIDNCLHLFIGYCAPQKSGSKTDEISQCTSLLSTFKKFSEQLETYEDRIYDAKNTNKKQAKERGATPEDLNGIDKNCKNDVHKLDKLRNALNGIDIENPGSSGHTVREIMQGTSVELNTIHETINIPSEVLDTNTSIVRSQKIEFIRTDLSSTVNYPSATSNYYYLHPLFEWNTDLIMSIKLFDEKVVASQLIESLTKCISFNGDVTISLQMQFIQEQIRDLTKKIIETDEGIVSDCFFSFSNDSYNNMLNEVELNRVRLHSVNSTTVNSVPSISEIMKSINTLSHNATKEELKSAISGSLFAAASCTGQSSNNQQYKLNTDFNVNFNIIDELLEQLVYVIISIVLQPKVYMLLMANLSVLGNEPNFDLSKFMQQFSDLISSLIKEIRDHILEYFKNELLKILQELVKTLAIKLNLEQYQYYITLLAHCFECFKLHNKEFDWTQDDVNYADITELNQQETQEC